MFIERCTEYVETLIKWGIENLKGENARLKYLIISSWVT